MPATARCPTTSVTTSQSQHAVRLKASTSFLSGRALGQLGDLADGDRAAFVAQREAPHGGKLLEGFDANGLLDLRNAPLTKF